LSRPRSSSYYRLSDCQGALCPPQQTVYILSLSYKVSAVVVTGIALNTRNFTSSHLFICRPGVQASHHVYQRDRMSDVHPGRAVAVDRTANDLYSGSSAAAML